MSIRKQPFTSTPPTHTSVHRCWHRSTSSVHFHQWDPLHVSKNKNKTKTTTKEKTKQIEKGHIKLCKVVNWQPYKKRKKKKAFSNQRWPQPRPHWTGQDNSVPHTLHQSMRHTDHGSTDPHTLTASAVWWFASQGRLPSSNTVNYKSIRAPLIIRHYWSTFDTSRCWWSRSHTSLPLEIVASEKWSSRSCYTLYRFQ